MPKSPAMKPAPIPANDAERLDALYQYDILDTVPEVEYDDITLLASQICGTPVATISLVDKDRQWFKSKVGLEATGSSREVSFCGHTILQTDVFIVNDAKQDERFHDNPLVTGEVGVRFYAGAPLITPEGQAIGSLCAIDRKAREITPEQTRALQALSRQVVCQLELRRHYMELAKAHQGLKEREAKISQLNGELHDLLERTFGGSVKVLSEILSLVEPQFFNLSRQVLDYAAAIAPRFEITDLWELETATLLSQIGYVTIPSMIIEKIRGNVPLRGTEQDLLTRVPAIGAKLLERIPRLERVSRIVLYQNKNFDGSGFPADGVASQNIPIEARIIKALFDMVRLEGQGVPRNQALEKMRSRSGLYDPLVLKAIFQELVERGFQGKDGQPRPMRVKDLEPNLTLASNVETNNGFLVVPSGYKTSPPLIEKIGNFASLQGVKEPIYVQP